MNASRIVVIAILVSLAAVTVQAQTYPPVTIPRSEARSLQSEIMDYNYGVFVTLPGSYAKNPDRVYPTLYIIDGNQYFGYTSEPYGSLIWGNMVKEHIAISVAYMPDQGNMRSRDFQATNRAADFVRFFREELIPFVEDNYRTSKADRTLFGHSLGGQFTLFTILTATDLFENYIACAPAVTDRIMELEEQYAASHNDLPIKMFLASGADDHLTIGAKRFVAKLESRNYPGLKFDKLYTVNGNHGTIQPSAYIEGLRFVLDKAIELSPAQMRRCAGTYIDGENTYTITYNGGKYLSFDGAPGSYDAPQVEWQKLYPASETEFFPKGWPGDFTFGGPTNAPAETFSFGSGRNRVEAKRK